jgi:hypothetical protein
MTLIGYVVRVLGVGLRTAVWPSRGNRRRCKLDWVHLGWRLQGRSDPQHPIHARTEACS